MKTIAPDQLLEQLNWRYATKQFDATRKIPADQWAALEDALVLSPSSFGLQPWAFVVVDDPKVREELKAASWNQTQITDASHLVVFAARTDVTAEDLDRFFARIAEVRGVPQESLAAYRGMIDGSILQARDTPARAIWTARQVYIALGTLLNSAALMGLDACPMEGIDPVAYNRILGLEEKGLTALMVATVGYRSPEDGYANLPKVRYEKKDVVLHV